MDGRFLDSFTLLPRQRVVCGRATKPLCLRHRIILTAIKSPFVDGARPPEPSDVVAFSKVVSSYDPAEMMPSSPSDEDVKWYAAMKDDAEVFVRQVGECLGCIEDQAKWPIFWNTTKSGRSTGAPWVLTVICNIVKNGVNLEDAWTMPESQAIWYNAVFSIANGSDINIVSEEDKRAMEQLKALEEAEKANKVEKPIHPRLRKTKTK